MVTVDIDKLSDFIATMPGERAEVTKTNLLAIERDLRAGAAAIAALRANSGIADVCASIAGHAAGSGQGVPA